MGGLGEGEKGGVRRGEERRGYPRGWMEFWGVWIRDMGIEIWDISRLGLYIYIFRYSSSWDRGVRAPLLYIIFRVMRACVGYQAGLRGEEGGVFRGSLKWEEETEREMAKRETDTLQEGRCMTAKMTSFCEGCRVQS